MSYPDPDTVKACIEAFLSSAESVRLPKWEELPSIPLYMDQVIYLLNNCLYSEGYAGAEKAITSAMVNNYIKQKIVPQTIRKHYFRHHLACLIIICVLKESVNISQIANLLPADMTEAAIKELYEEFLSIFQEAGQSTHICITSLINPNQDMSGAFLHRFTMRLAITSTMNASLAKQLLNLMAAEKKESKKQSRNVDSSREEIKNEKH